MEEAGKVHEEAPEPPVLSDNQVDKKGASSFKGKKDPTEEGNEELKSKMEEEKTDVKKRIMSLQKRLTTLVTNIQTAADAKEMERRSGMEDNCRIREERLKDDAKACQEKVEEIRKGWLIVNQKVVHSELQSVLDSQQQLCAAVIEDKKKLIRELQWERRVKEDQYLKNLRRLDEEIKLMLDRMQQQFQNLSKAYREELTQLQGVYQQEIEVLLAKDKAKLKEHMKEHWDTELESLMERRRMVEESEKTIHDVMLENTTKIKLMQLKENAKSQARLREQQQMKGKSVVLNFKQLEHGNKNAAYNAKLGEMKGKILGSSKEVKNLKTKYAKQKDKFMKQRQYLCEVQKRSRQHYERIQKEVRYTTAADARKFEEMWVMMEEEVTQLAEKASAIDSLICKHLGLAWERPSAAFMESPGPRRSQEHDTNPTSHPLQTRHLSHCSQRMMDASVGPSLERDSEHGTGVEEGELSSEMLMKVMELLCDETGFLVEDKLRKLLAPMEKNEQTTVKLHSLFAVLGLEEKDLAKLAEFLLMYKHQQGEQTVGHFVEEAEAMENSATADSTSTLINPNNILPALRCFLEQHRKSVHERSSLSHPARDTSVEEAYWDRLGNIITEDKLKLWDAAERELKQYEEVLMDISELVPETELLRQQNTKLRMQLQQILSSTRSSNE
ncbi:dynein regulatory complex protein 1 isoform X2 [Simochromis diagramma]|uniref:dynein regulatory complex protein 1 isoform X2 n=1 Tax=Simochromis diagramma TaxID=43689 RepID=UPI001A7EECC4|nr:dynein regulatory complex protein 1 isoform X2 [Simochromis diagramma]